MKYYEFRAFKKIDDKDILEFAKESEGKRVEVEEIPQWVADELAKPMLQIPGITC